MSRRLTVEGLKIRPLDMEVQNILNPIQALLGNCYHDRASGHPLETAL